jgi:hypothetical protein
LRDDATNDEAWIYKLARHGNRRRSRVVNANVRTAISKYGARVEILTLTRESKKDFYSFELESVPGMFMYRYPVPQQDTNVDIMTEYVVKLPRSSRMLSLVEFCSASSLMIAMTEDVVKLPRCTMIS